MATIQIRNIPDEVHRVYRARAASAGMSLLEYLLADMVDSAARQTPGELVADIAAALRSEEAGGYSSVSSAAVVRADRESH